MAKRGDLKGDEFENEACRLFTRWLCGEELASRPVAELPFRRRSTIIRLQLQGWVGGRDVMHVSTVHFPFCVEAKKQEGWTFDGLTLSNEGWLPWTWWRQAVRQAEQTPGDAPLLVFTRNRKPTHVMMTESCARVIELKSVDAPIVELRPPHGDVLVVSQVSNLVLVPPKMLLRLKDPVEPHRCAATSGLQRAAVEEERKKRRRGRRNGCAESARG